MATEDDPLGFDPDRDYSKGDRLKMAVGKYIRAILQLLVRAGQTGALVKSPGDGGIEVSLCRSSLILSIHYRVGEDFRYWAADSAPIYII
jgi:hypothetical protein